MAKIHKIIPIDFKTPINDIATAVQGDINSRVLDVLLYDGGIPYNLSGYTPRIVMRKPDGTTIFNDGVIRDANNGRVEFELTNQALAMVGTLEVQIKIFDDANKQILSSNIFNLFVTENLLDDDTVESSNEYGSLVILFQNIYECITTVQDLNDKIGIPGEKGIELSTDTLFKEIEYLIDFSEKNSVGSLGEKLDNLKNEIENIKKRETIKNWTLLPSLKFQVPGVSESKPQEEIINVTGKGYLILCVFENLIDFTSGSQSYKIEVDGETIFDVKINFNNVYDRSKAKYSQVGIVNNQYYTSTMPIDNKNFEVPILKTQNGSFHNKIHLALTNKSIKPLSSTKYTLYNDNNDVAQYGGYDDKVYIPAQINLNEPLKFERSLKVTVYDTTGVTRSGNGVACQCIYSLDE